MRYTKSALGLLNAQYRSVLKKCLLINLGLFAIAAISATPAMAADATITVDTSGNVSGSAGTVDTTINLVNVNAAVAAVNDGTSGLATKTTLAAVITDAQSTTSGSLGAAIAAEAAKTDAGTLGAAIDTKISNATISSANVSGLKTGATTDVLTGNIADNTTSTNLVTAKQVADYVGATSASSLSATTGTGDDTLTTTVNASGISFTKGTGTPTPVFAVDTNTGTVKANGNDVLTTNSTLDGAKLTAGTVDFTALDSTDVVNSTTGIAAAASASDVKLVTEKAVATALATKVGTSDIATSISSTSDDSHVASAKAVYDYVTANTVTADSSTTLTNKTIDGDDNTIQDLGTGVFKTGVLQTTVRDTSTASDSSLATEKAVATALAGKQDQVVAGSGIALASDKKTLSVDTTVIQTKLTSSSGNNGNGIAITDAGVISVTAGNGVEVGASGVAVKAGNGVEVGTSGVAVKAATNGGIAVGSGGVSVDVDGTTLEVNTTSGKVQIKAGGVDTAQLADDAVTLDKIADANWTSTAVAAGSGNTGSATVLATTSSVVGTINNKAQEATFTKTGSQTSLGTANTIQTAINNVATQVDTNTGSITNLNNLVGSADTAKSAVTTDLLYGKAITGDTSVDGHTSVIDAIKTISTTAAGTALNNTFTGTNTFNNANGIKIQDGAGGNDVSLTATSAGLGISDNVAITGTLSTTGNATVGGTLQVGGANAITGSGSTLNMGNNNLTGVGYITAQGLTTDATNGVDLGLNGKQTDIIGSTVNVGDAATTTVNLGTGAATTTVNVGNTNTTTTTIKGKTIALGDANTTATNIKGSTVTMEADASHKIAVSSSGTAITGDASISGVTTATGGVKFGDDTTAMTSASHSGAIAAGATAQGAVVASTQTIADTRAAINTEVAGVVGGAFKVNTDKTVSYDNTALAGTNGFDNTATNLTGALTNFANNTKTATGVTYAANGTVTTTYAAHDTSTVSYTKNADGTSLKAAIDKIDNAIGDAMTTTGDSTKRATAAFQTGASKTVNANLAALDAAIGTDADLTNTTVSTASGDNNGVKVANSVNRNIAALNAAVGDVSTLKAGTGATGDAITNGTGTAATTVVQAINNIDATLGNIHGLYDNTTHTVNSTTVTSTVNGNSNLANGTTVEDHLVSLDNAVGDRTLTSLNGDINTAMSGTSLAAGLKTAGDKIGDMDFSSAHYVGGDQDLSSAVRTLDSNIYRIDNDVRELKHDFRAGMASMAAMSALVPNPRSQGDTSLSLGTGAYEGHTAMAIGGFHYINDNLMLNAGVSWGNSSESAYRIGVTYSW